MAQGNGRLNGGDPLIDTDIHNVVPGYQALLPYLSAHWKDYVTQTSFKGPVDTAYPPNVPTSARPGSKPADGPPGSSLSLLREQVLDPDDVETGILTCAYGVESVHNPDAAAAMASAVNDWALAEWLQPEPRLRGSLVVPVQQPEMAAREIERLGDQPGFVQVYLPVRSRALYGNRFYYPMFEAIAKHNLVVGLHFGGAPGNPPTASGWPSYYIEDYVGMAAVFQSQILNMVVEGLFDRFPTLRVALLEAGLTWMPSLMWRLDKEWKGLRREVPWNRMLPSEYIRQHMRVALQPLDRPPSDELLLQVLDEMGSDEMVMYSSDYPHDHGGRDGETVPTGLPAPLRRKIAYDNAKAFYRL